MKRILPIIASVFVLIIALSFAYYFVIFLPSKEKTRQEIETQKELDEKTWQEFNLKECLSEAEKKYQEVWNEERNNCLRQFPSN